MLLFKKNEKKYQEGKREAVNYVRFLAKRQIKRYKKIQGLQFSPINKMTYQHQINALSDLIDEINEYQPIKKHKVLCNNQE